MYWVALHLLILQLIDDWDINIVEPLKKPES